MQLDSPNVDDGENRNRNTWNLRSWTIHPSTGPAECLATVQQRARCGGAGLPRDVGLEAPADLHSGLGHH